MIGLEYITWQDYYYEKEGVGEDVQQKIWYVNSYCYEEGLTDEQRKLVLGLIDHESAGTWDENIVGDNGCSTGIGQWNHCTNMYPPETFEEQTKLIVEQMAQKFKENSNDWAVSKHNSPYGSYKTSYVNKVYTASELFN